MLMSGLEWQYSGDDHKQPSVRISRGAVARLKLIQAEYCVQASVYVGGARFG